MLKADVIDAWIENKVECELNPVRLRPTPTEFALYLTLDLLVALVRRKHQREISA